MSTSSLFQTENPKGVELSAPTVEVLTRYAKKGKAITFDEITLEDKPSDYHPSEVKLHSFISRNIKLKACGILSAAMDTVTEKEMALAMARMGGIGIIHRNLDPETQASMVNWVRKKIHSGGMIDKPITFSPTDHYSEVQKEVEGKGYTFTSFPIVDDNGKLLGLLTRDEVEFIEGTNPQLQEIMKPRSQTVTASLSTNSDEAYKIMREKKVKKLIIVDDQDVLKGIYVWNDVKNDQKRRDLFSLDSDGHFLVGAAIGVAPSEMTRATLLVENNCKVLVIDCSHGACKPARDLIGAIRQKFGNSVDIIVGNIASYDSAKYLLDSDHKPDGLKVGIGPGSICTTRQVTGHGVPQVSAVFEVWRAVKEHGDRTGYYLPIIADGGIRNSGDIVKALSVGASAVMLGSVFAGTFESPGLVITKNGKRFKTIRGMGSRAAMEERSGSRMRYSQQKTIHSAEGLTSEQKDKVVPEGVEGLVQFKGPVQKVINELVGGVQAGLSHTGAISVAQFQASARFWIQSTAGVIEGRPHDLVDVRD